MLGDLLGRTRPRSAWSAVVLAPCLAVSLAACGEVGDRDADGGAAPDTLRPSRGGTAVVAVSSPPTTFVPALARSSLDGELGGALFLGLSHARWRETEGDARVEYVQDTALALADRRRFGRDSTTLTYRLNPRHRWSDGRPVRPADVVFTYGLLGDPGRALPLSGVAESIDSVTALGDTAVTFHFRRRYPRMLFDTGVGILPAHVFRPLTREGEQLAAAAAEAARRGEVPFTGPFRLVEWSPRERVVLARNDGNPAVSPRLDTVAFRVLPDQMSRASVLRAGNVHLAEIGSFTLARELSAGPAIRIERVPKRAYDYIAWNPEGHPAFRDDRVREALSLALDRREVLRTLNMTPYAVPARGPYGPLFPRLSPDTGDALHDSARARRLLDEAGWRLPGGGEVRRRGGRELAFRLLVPSSGRRRRDAAQIVQRQLSEVGVRADIRLQDFNALFARVREGDYEAAMLGWQVSLDPDIGVFWYDASSPLNVVGYQRAAVRRLIDSARAAPTREAAAPLWRRVGELVAADHPYAFLWYFDVLYAARARLRAVDLSPLGIATRIHEWWMVPSGTPAGGGRRDGA